MLAIDSIEIIKGGILGVLLIFKGPNIDPKQTPDNNQKLLSGSFLPRSEQPPVDQRLEPFYGMPLAMHIGWVFSHLEVGLRTQNRSHG